MRLKVFPAEPQEQKGGSSSSPSPSAGPAGGPNDQKCKRPKMECDEQGVI